MLAEVSVRSIKKWTEWVSKAVRRITCCASCYVREGEEGRATVWETMKCLFNFVEINSVKTRKRMALNNIIKKNWKPLGLFMNLVSIKRQRARETTRTRRRGEGSQSENIIIMKLATEFVLLSQLRRELWTSRAIKFRQLGWGKLLFN